MDSQAYGVHALDGHCAQLVPPSTARHHDRVSAAMSLDLGATALAKPSPTPRGLTQRDLIFETAKEALMAKSRPPAVPLPPPVIGKRRFENTTDAWVKHQGQSRVFSRVDDTDVMPKIKADSANAQPVGKDTETRFLPIPFYP